MALNSRSSAIAKSTDAIIADEMQQQPEDNGYG
jgi:hypothetical protein